MQSVNKQQFHVINSTIQSPKDIPGIIMDDMNHQQLDFLILVQLLERIVNHHPILNKYLFI